jgi:hypothetical protein
MDVVPVTAFSISAMTGVIPAPMQIVGGSVSVLALILNNVYLRHRMTPAPVATVIDVAGRAGTAGTGGAVGAAGVSQQSAVTASR